MTFHPPQPQSSRSSLDVCVIGSTYPRSPEDPLVPWLRESVNRLARRGHRVTVIAPSFEGLGTHAIDGVPVLRFRYAPRSVERLTHDEGAPNKVRRGLYPLLAVPYVLLGAARIARWTAQRHFDLIHIHWPFPHGLMVSLSGASSRVPVVATCHGAELAMARRSKLISRVLRRSLLAAQVLSCNSSHTRSQIERLCGRTAAVIPYGATVSGAAEPRPDGGPADPALLLFCGRLIQRKGIDVLIRALPRVLAKRRVKLLVTGEGDRRREWEELAARLGLRDAVQFLGFVENARLSELYRTCDLYVHPAVVDDRQDTEGLGVVLIEALMNRCPVIASAVGGIVDVIAHQQTGLLVPEKDEAALAAAILLLLEDRALARRLGEAGRRFAESHFDWDRITDATEQLYLQALELAGRPVPRAAGGREGAVEAEVT